MMPISLKVTIIICLSVIVTLAIILNYCSNLPQYKCNHEIETIKIWEGARNSEWLSTCKKCGLQRTHWAGPNNTY